MKKILFTLLLSSIACVAQNAVKFSGKIANPNSEKLTLTGANFKKEISVAKDGSFSSSFDVPEGIYQVYDGAEYTEVFLKNGFDLKLTMDTKEFDESIKYTGKGANENNLLAKKTLDEEALNEKIPALQSKPEELQKVIQEYSESLNKSMTASGIDPGLKKAFDAQRAAQMAEQAKMMEQRKALEAKNAKMNGNPSPTFEYENHKGGKTKLADLYKGKYVYIDTWATWCGPCRQEIPHLQKVEEKYHGRNVEFVSISIDEKKDYEKWKKFVDEKKLGGTQLYADNAWKSEWVQAFGINSIPRFILIGPDGKVIDSDAARPSDPQLQAQLDELLSK